MNRKEIRQASKVSEEYIELIGKYISGTPEYSCQQKQADVKAKMDAFVLGTAEISDVIAMFTSLELKHITKHTAAAPEVYISRIVKDYRQNENYLASLKAADAISGYKIGKRG